jgi:hypothetical protein
MRGWDLLEDIESFSKLTEKEALPDDSVECIVAVKYFSEVGWVGVKNRDRNYKPTIRIIQSFKDDIERMFLWDEKTRYTEGLNEFGVSILSAAVAVKNDENEGSKGDKSNSGKTFYSPDGKKIRTALLEKTVEDAIKSLVENKLPGNTAIFNRENAYLLEGAFKGGNTQDYIYKLIKISKEKVMARTNHGILIPWSGYQFTGDEKEKRARLSSEFRLKKVLEDIKKVKYPHDMLDCVSSTEKENPQLNPLRIDEKPEALRTTGQLMIVPDELTLYYRPVWCEVEFDFAKLDSLDSKTYFQILSSRDIFTKFRNSSKEPFEVKNEE